MAAIVTTHHPKRVGVLQHAAPAYSARSAACWPTRLWLAMVVSLCASSLAYGQSDGEYASNVLSLAEDSTFGGRFVALQEPGSVDLGYIRAFGGINVSGHFLRQDAEGHHYGHDVDSLNSVRLEASYEFSAGFGSGAGFLSLGHLTTEGQVEEAEGTLLGIGLEFDIGSLSYLRAEVQSTVLEGQSSGLEMENRRLALTAAFRF